MKPNEYKIASTYKAVHIWVAANLGWVFLITAVVFLGTYYHYIFDEIYIHEHVRNIILGLGGLGGAYGLVISSRRQNHFSKQVEQGQSQLFLDQLGRGIDQLANPEKIFRTAGIRVLEDLALTSGKIELIRNLLFEFLKSKAHVEPVDYYPADSVDYDLNHPAKDRDDIFAAADALINLTVKGKDNHNLEFYDLDLSFYSIPTSKSNLIALSFFRCRMEHSYCEGSKYRLWFSASNLKSSGFPRAQCREADFSEANLTDVIFSGTNLQRANFTSANLTGASFNHAKLKGARFYGANLQGTNFGFSDCTGIDLNKVKNLDSNRIFNIFYENGNPPINLPETVTLPEGRAYKWTESGDRQLIASGEII